MIEDDYEYGIQWVPPDGGTPKMWVIKLSFDAATQEMNRLAKDDLDMSCFRMVRRPKYREWEIY